MDRQMYPEERQRILMMKNLPYIFVAMLLAGCVSVSSKWEGAQRANTESSYEAFLQEFPQSQYAPQAKDRIEQLRFDQAKRENSEAAYQGYERTYPQGRFVAESRKLADDCAFASAAKQNTQSAFEAYMKTYPNGAHHGDAKQGVEAVVYQEAIRNGQVSALDGYMQRYPAGRFAAEAKEALVEACLKEARASKRLSAWRRFAALQSGHPAADEARKAISTIEDAVRTQKAELGVPITNGDFTVTVSASKREWSPGRRLVERNIGKPDEEYIEGPDGVFVPVAMARRFKGYQILTISWRSQDATASDKNKMNIEVKPPSGSTARPSRGQDGTATSVEYVVPTDAGGKPWTVVMKGAAECPPISFIPEKLP